MSIAKNYVYNVIYQITLIIIPLITVPYISRVLGSSGVGINAYTNSIVQYFVLLGTIGISLYGNRAIAYVRDNKVQLSKTFWGITILKFMTTFISFMAFLLFLNYTKGYHLIFLIQSIYILAAAIDVSWLFMGLEDFRKTVVRNLIVRIMGVICIFIFVRNASDLWKYVSILAASQLFGQMTMWIYLPRIILMTKLKWKDIYTHIRPSFSFFVPQVAVQIYLFLNKTMLGYMSTTSEVGMFDNSDKVVRMTLAIVTSMGVVMLPRVAHTFAIGKKEMVKKYLVESFDFATYLSVPIAFGLAGIAQTFTPWFFGPGFEKTGILICVISPIVVLIAWSNVLGQQFLMPIGQLNWYTISVVCGAIVNFLLNFTLINKYQSVGTAVASVIAEIVVTLIQMLYVNTKIKANVLFKSSWKYFLSGLIMFLLVYFIGGMLPKNFLTTIIQIVMGIITYFSLMFVLHSKINQKVFIKIYDYLSIKKM
jgi:O-antigen/teichoic acid export membrane protein